jgi:purine-cytosine permease-like protein
MVTVSATALGVWFNFRMPALNDWLPNSVGWVIAVLVSGAMIAVVAAYGYQIVAKIGEIAAPWMVLVFIAFGLVGLGQFINATGTKIASLSDLWALANAQIWKGGDPQPGQVKFTFWHVMFFAWFCNMAMHIGMSDLSVLRFAKKTWYGVASATGMFLGHYLAWLAAAILYALQLHREPGNTSVLPGPLAYQAAGLTGLVCVIIAGWTTANPTIYRAGLAFQAVIPKSSRFRVTLITGAIATIAAMFPALAMKLLDFVALYGLILMPMGAVVFVDFWVIPKLGLRSSYAALSGRHFNWAAGAAWVVTLAVCLGIVFLVGRWTLWFVALPGWFIASIVYIALSRVYQRQTVPSLAQPQVRPGTAQA